MLSRLEKNRTISLIITIIIAIGIYLFSSIPSTSIPSSGLDLSIVYHFTIFFLFGLFLLITIKGEKETERHHVFLVLVISILYAALDEIHQGFTPGRSVSLFDFFIDSLGIICSIVFYEKIRNTKILKKN